MGRAPRPNLLLDLDGVRTRLPGAPRTWQHQEQCAKARFGGSQNVHPCGAQRRHWRGPPSREPGLEHARPGPPSVALGGSGLAASKCRRTDMCSFEVNGDQIPSSEDLVSSLTDWGKMMRTNSDEAVPVIKQRWAFLREQLQAAQDLALRLHPEGHFRARRPVCAPEPSRPARGHNQEVRPAANKFGI
eukprot:9486471-Pyramimonas_sp.AAC.1